MQHFVWSWILKMIFSLIFFLFPSYHKAQGACLSEVEEKGTRFTDEASVFLETF